MNVSLVICQLASACLGVYIRRHAVLLCDLLLAIYVHLDELHLSWLGLLLCQALEDWRDCLAWPAPIRVEVDDGICGLREELGEVRSRGYRDDFAGHRGYL
jgi:hypothetical protein